ncbi:DUF4190 domain-containing protein [Nocardia huaxiensis]|uniref:DUF4190 domain-containing protein n=1 Tax=Nocardia huaxiensis TaxID=2755382 RepID=A0A7D6ZI90_9NOCA|nr:DUF4190 domain-containing protein [Nocardia huaxiensis]QLY31247.1 DUF4190 domain-containing protein [Nocardia huaxiensis]UFS94786.1 DUF4190 domain-containing protein [Nocardia huaxiensis]
MTNPGDSDEWWKQYSGEGVSPDSPSSGSAPQQPAPPPAGYSSAPNLQKPQSNPPSQPQYGQQSDPYGQQPYGQSSSPSNPAAAYPPPAPAPAPYGYSSGGYQQPAAGGYQQPYPGASGYQPYGYPQQTMGTNGLAIASLVTSLIGLLSVFFCLFIPIISVVGLILGVIGWNQTKTSGQDGKGMALAGLWVGVAGVVISVGFWLLVAVGVSSGSY